jgi:anti-anti-sigma regulatory factor
MEIAIKKTKTDGIIVVLSGEITGLKDADVMFFEVTGALSETIPYFVFDFTKSSLPNSRFLGKMMEVYKSNKSRGVQTFIFCGGNNLVKDLFKVAYVDHIIPIIADITDAATLASKANDPPPASPPV